MGTKELALILKHRAKLQKQSKERKKKANELDANEYWAGLLNIYYSCFTLVLGILGMRNGGDFLDIYCVIFTVLLTILVIYANGQKFHQRASDLRANCRDYDECILELSINCLQEDKKNGNEQESEEDDDYRYIIEQIKKGMLLSKDSESPFDAYKDLPHLNKILVLILTIIPIVFVFFYHSEIWGLLN